MNPYSGSSTIGNRLSGLVVCKPALGLATLSNSALPAAARRLAFFPGGTETQGRHSELLLCDSVTPRLCDKNKPAGSRFEVDRRFAPGATVGFCAKWRHSQNLPGCRSLTPSRRPKEPGQPVRFSRLRNRRPDSWDLMHDKPPPSWRIAALVCRLQALLLRPGY